MSPIARRAVGQPANQGDRADHGARVKRFRGSRGVVAVEMAIVAPLLVLFLIGSAQVGLVVIGNAVGTNAAREGVRVASIRYECADNHLSARCTANPSTDYNVIKAAVMAKLVGLVKTNSVTVNIVCRRGSATGTIISCEKGVAIPDSDVVEVTVGWKHIGARASSATAATPRWRGRSSWGDRISPAWCPNPTRIRRSSCRRSSPSDVNTDGIIDRLQMTFDEDIQQTVATSAFTVANSPTGSNAITAATVSARTVTLTLSGATVNTAPGAMTLSLAASPTGVKDVFGNQASFGPTTAPTDGPGRYWSG